MYVNEKHIKRRLFWIRFEERFYIAVFCISLMAMIYVGINS